jgi:hypothetical protein
MVSVYDTRAHPAILDVHSYAREAALGSRFRFFDLRLLDPIWRLTLRDHVAEGPILGRFAVLRRFICCGRLQIDTTRDIDVSHFARRWTLLSRSTFMTPRRYWPPATELSPGM